MSDPVPAPPRADMGPSAVPGTSAAPGPSAVPGPSAASGPAEPDAQAPAPRSTRSRILRALAAVVLLGATALAVGGSLDGAGTELSAAADHPGGIVLLVLAVLANAVGLTLSMLSWRVLVADGATRLPMPVAARIFFIGFISKFVPGRIWGVLAHLRLGRDAGVAPERMLSGFGLGLVIGVVTGAWAGLLVAPAVLGAYAWTLAPLVLAAAAAYARPGWVNHLVARALKAARRPPVEPGSPRSLRRSLLFALASWGVSGLHLWALAVLFGAPAGAALPVAVGGFALATVAGSLAFVLPDGIGARELVLLAPLAAVMPPAAATATVIASRLVCVLSEVAATGAALLWARLARPAPAAPSRTTVPEGIR
ncbi:lysylphosphatidylglycerol synthase domain-containing protein [Streptomyces sp. NPDC058953]|uniref:lysylphosphatidylglycerol synthase domain-containing protein n=1 Tax=Streptomyces sp. NPDC058953 TaxID=3346676 RepID=UPI0036B15A8F